MRFPEDISEADLADINSTASQKLLRVVRDAILAGRLKAPRDAPSQPLARRVQEFREEFDCDVHVLSTSRERINVLVAPRDGMPLFVLRFDAMESIAPTGCPQ